MQGRGVLQGRTQLGAVVEKPHVRRPGIFVAELVAVGDRFHASLVAVRALIDA